MSVRVLGFRSHGILFYSVRDRGSLRALVIYNGIYLLYLYCMPNSNRKFIIVCAVLVIAVLGIFWYSNARKGENVPINTTPLDNGQINNGAIPPSSPNLVLESPVSGVEVSGKLVIKGKAKGWFFEGSFPYKLVDDKGVVISSGPIQATEEWMTADFVTFNHSFEFYTDRPSGTLILMKDNPSDDRSRDESVAIPLVFKSVEGMSVNAYFGNTIFNPNQIDCSKVYVVERKTAKSSQTATAAIKELLKGPTEAERAQGYASAINSGTELKSIKIQNGIATIDFNNMLGAGVAGSCRVGAIRAEIEETLKQFSTIKSVVISIEGNTEDILQP